MIYFILNERANAVKIGVATNVKQRLSSLQIGSIDELKAIGIMHAENDYQLEAYLHALFNKYRLRGEWFRYSEVIKSYIEKEAEPYAVYVEQKEPEPVQVITTKATETESGIKVTIHRTPNKEQQSLFVQKLEEIIRESKAA